MALLELVQDYPRPELFAIDTDALFRTLVSVVAIGDTLEGADSPLALLDNHRLCVRNRQVNSGSRTSSATSCPNCAGSSGPAGSYHL